MGILIPALLCINRLKTCPTSPVQLSGATADCSGGTEHG